MTFDEALAQLEMAMREHGAAVEDLLVRLRNGAISKSSSLRKSLHFTRRSKGMWRN